MKKLYFLLCLVLTTIAGTAQLVTEPFNYTPSTNHLPTTSGGAWVNVNSGDNIIVAAGNLSYPGFAPSTGNKVTFDGAGADAYRSFTTQSTAGTTVYYSFLLNVSALGSMNTTGGYFIALTEGTTSTNIGAAVWARTSGTGFNIGVSTRSSSATTWLSPTLTVGTTYLVVVSYNLVAGTGNDQASIWLNPVTLGGSAPPADAAAVAGTDMANAGRLQLRQDAATTTPFVEIDELRIGTDYASVTPKDPAYTTATLNVSPLASFGSQCINSTYGPNTLNIGGMNLSSADITVGPLAGYSFSTTSGGTYTNTLTLTQTGGNYFQTIYVKFNPTAVQSYNGNIPVSGGGASATNVAAVGAGISAPVVTTGASSSITTSGAMLAGSIVNNGCSAPTAYGIEYSTTNNFTPGTGTQVASTNLTAGSFTATLSGLNPGVTYYYVAFATNGSGTGYGNQSSFTTAVPPSPTQAPVATAATAITTTGFTGNWNSTAEATNYRLDVFTESTATLTNTNIAGWNMTNQYIPKYADTGTIYNVVNIDSFATNATNGITNANGPSGGVGTTPNPFALQATGWDAGQDTKFWEMQVSTLGATNLTLSSLQGSSTTGPANFKVQYKVGTGGSYTDIPGATVALTTAVQAGQLNTWGTISNVAVPVAAENQPVVFFRWIMTNNTSVNGGTVAATGTSRIAAVYVKGNYTGTVRTYVPGYQNLSTGNVTTYNVTGLTGGTTYYYVVRAENAGGFSQNSNKITVVTTAATPAAITTTTPNPFNSVCINATSNPQSFTITGTNLTAADVTVGPLAGYTFSTTSGGTYNSTLTLTQPGGSFSQQVFVKLTPTAAQSYDGNIPVAGGGLATPVNVAVTGTGINPVPTVLTGGISGLTTTTATLNGIVGGTCSPITSYGFVYSTTNGFNPATSGTTVNSTNLSGGGFSAPLTSLTPNTTYYYVVFATNSAGTTYTTQGQFTTINTPVITVTPLTAFGGVCLNTGSTVQSFNVNGSNTNGTAVTVNALPGFAFSSSATGPFFPTFSLPAVVGSVNQTVFVQFTPTAVQSYNGNILVNGGGAPDVNVPVSAFGINTAPSVSTGAATSVTATAATIAGDITAAGCTAVSGYGIKYSTTNGFNPATTGTQVAGSNLAAGSFTVPVTGLTPSTTYYYVVYATNAGGTTYGTQQSFTTLTPAVTATTLATLGNVCLNTASAAQSFTITGTNLTGTDIVVGPLAGYTFSTTSGGTYANTLTITPASGAVNQQVFVKLTPTAVQSYNGNISIAGGGLATAVNVAATGAGINTTPTVTTAAATGVSGTGATIPGTISSNGCSAPTAYGVIWSTTNGFNPATTGTNVAGTGITGGNFNVNLTGLTAGVTYYYVTYATNAGGTAYSTQGSFTTATAAIPVAPVATAATNVTSTGFTANWNAVAGATGYFLDVYTMGAGSGTTTIAGWDMATTTDANRTANQGNAANNGSALLTATTGAATVTYSYPAGPTATTGTNPQSVSTSGWDAGVDTKYWMVAVNTTGATNLKLSSLQGGSNTGPRDWKVQYRVGATGIWNDVPGGTIAITTPPVAANPATFFGVTDLALPAAAENQPLVQIRWVITSTTSVNGGTVAAGGTNRITAIYLKSTGTASVPVYVTGYQNLPVNNVTSYNVTGLTPSTTYYYVVRASNAAGTSPNSNEIPVTTLAGPSLTATALTAFGNLCPNSTSATNSFTINGSNLSNANITVGPLAGYAFSTTAAGPFAPSLTLTQASGTYSQTVFVQLTPTAVQSYDGNIPVSGGGVATAVNVAASGAGVSNPPAVTTGAAAAVTNTTATLAGSITNNGCTAVTQYGFEWSTTAGFANGTGTQVLSTNLAGTAFTGNLSGLSANTTYYFKAFATNSGGTTYGAQQSFTTAAGPVISLSASPLAGFNGVCVNTTALDSFTVTGVNLTNANVALTAPAGFELSTSRTGPFTSSLSLTQPGGAYSQKVYVRFVPTAAQTYAGFIQLSGGGFGANINQNVTGTSIATPPTVVTGDSSNIRFDGVTLRGSFGAAGCSAVTQYGIEYSTIANFAAGSGLQVPATANTAGAFSVTLNNLMPGITYYYRAYARNAGAIDHGIVKSVTLPGLQAGLGVYPQPIAAGGNLRVTLTGIEPGNYGISLYSSAGEVVYRRYLNVQATFINEQLQLPASLPAGVYVLRITGNTSVVAHRTILVVR
ncbi:MAG: T9SS type A sorting domain-containing protein [Chitinophagaceae bacterium]|nr:MAG: T9SS type A sorting domain-containing protein [Chitinophagaceae bacterium]